ncbi:nucleotidyltransferase family protein [Mesorhizobium japonicum]|uniref:nucleotidyltransferase family protein n=1 Tax=Mesorhizobium japonicum TaxID=2066070 RepID=UPI003B5C2EA7
MRAILLSGGYGTRLRPLTLKTPKCLMPIKNKPLLEIWFERLSEANLGPLLVNTHYLSDQVEKYVNASKYKDRVTLVHEDLLLGTAGTLIRNLDFYKGGDGLLIHADNYCLANFAELQIAHRNRPSECLMTMLTFRTDSPTTSGIVELDKRGVVIGFHEKTQNPPGNLANGAIYILSSGLIDILRKNLSHVKDFSTEVIPLLMGKIYSHETYESLIDIGSIDSYKRANE